MNPTSASIWVVIIAVGLGTFLLRASGIVLLGKREQPEWLQRALRYVPPAILGALLSSSLLIRDNAIDIGFDNHRLMAAILATAVAWWRKSLFWTIAAGMIALWLWSLGATALATT